MPQCNTVLLDIRLLQLEVIFLLKVFDSLVSGQLHVHVVKVLGYTLAAALIRAQGDEMARAVTAVRVTSVFTQHC